jgi:hypothetical protein
MGCDRAQPLYFGGRSLRKGRADFGKEMNGPALCGRAVYVRFESVNLAISWVCYRRSLQCSAIDTF